MANSPFSSDFCFLRCKCKSCHSVRAVINEPQHSNFQPSFLFRLAFPSVTHIHSFPSYRALSRAILVNQPEIGLLAVRELHPWNSCEQRIVKALHSCLAFWSPIHTGKFQSSGRLGGENGYGLEWHTKHCFCLNLSPWPSPLAFQGLFKSYLSWFCQVFSSLSGDASWSTRQGVVFFFLKAITLKGKQFRFTAWPTWRSGVDACALNARGSGLPE